MTNEQRLISENALQRIGRQQDRPPLLNLEPNLFSHGPEVKEVIEVCGDSGVGKTFLMKELTKKCILPKSYLDIPLGGLEAGVIYLNSDLHFNAGTFGNFVMGFLEEMITTTLPNKDEIVKNITEISLKRLTIMNIYNSETMYVTFHLLKTLLLSNKEVSLIIIDSIGANYWQDRMTDGIRKMDSYILHVLSRLFKCIESFKVTVIFTRPSYFQTKTAGAIDVSPVCNLSKVNTSIQLMRSKSEGETSYHATIKNSKSSSLKLYSIGPKGITWSPNQ
ncbi:DNA repair protein XRCC2 [Halyomorpha halys]|uniref:DNA repair protein XRCC2 n=1 Tax=Halyomorpha halys TaxID=286706 RepID=UPI000D0C7531|nr:DNA repair protein XRCC2-like [Halyomorpha halys]